MRRRLPHHLPQERDRLRPHAPPSAAGAGAVHGKGGALTVFCCAMDSKAPVIATPWPSTSLVTSFVYVSPPSVETSRAGPSSCAASLPGKTIATGRAYCASASLASCACRKRWTRSAE